MAGRELTAQEVHKQVVNQVLKEKRPMLGDDEAEQRILDQLPQCPLHPFKASNQKWRKWKKIKQQYDELKGNTKGGNYEHEEKVKHGYDLDKAAQEFLDSDASTFPVHGDPSKGNMNDLLRSNIMRCQYFKVDLFEKKTYHEVINEIDIHVGYVEPWTIGTHGVPSTIFCCLYKWMLMRLSMKQIFGMVKETNPYTRCTGFLYIRYLWKPELLWHFLSPFMMDDQEFEPTPSTGETTTIGEYVEKLLADQHYYSTILPRIPALIDKEVKKRLLTIPEKRKRRRDNLENLTDFKQGRPLYILDPATSEWYQGNTVEVTADGITISYYHYADETSEGEEVQKSLDLSEVLPCLDDYSDNESNASEEYHREKKHKKSKKHRSRRSRSRSDSKDSRRRKRNKGDRYDSDDQKVYKPTNQDRKDRYLHTEPITRDLDEQVRRIRSNRESNSTKKDHNAKGSSYKTTLSSMPAGGKNKSRSPSPEYKFVEIENKAKERKTEKVLTIDEDEIERQNRVQNERLERLKKLYQN